MTKRFFYDCETTGTDEKKHSIHQLSFQIDIDGEVEEKGDVRICPYTPDDIDPAALAVSDVTEEQIRAYPNVLAAHAELVTVLSKYVDKYDKRDKFHLVGYNNRGFDDRFLRRVWDVCGDKYFGSFFWADSIDVMVLASDYWIDRRPELRDFKLRTVASFTGLSVDDSRLHDAQYDIELTRSLYNALRAE